MSLVAKLKTRRAHVSGIVLFQLLICFLFYTRLRDCYLFSLKAIRVGGGNIKACVQIG